MSETNCTGAGCDRTLLSETTWRSMSADERQAARAAGKAANKGHNQCNACRNRARRHGTDQPGAHAPVRGELVLLDWHWLHETGQLDESMTLNERCRLAAPRIGMSVGALEKALQRAGIRNPVEPSVSLRRTSTGCVQCTRHKSLVGMAEGDLAHVERRMAKHPNMPRLLRLFAERQADLAAAMAAQDMHAAEHAEDVAA